MLYCALPCATPSIHPTFPPRSSDGHGQKHLHAGFMGCGNKAFSEQPSSAAAFGNMYMNGSEVFKFAVRAVPRVVEASLKKAGLSVADLDWLVLHQANQRILTAAADRLGVPAGACACDAVAGDALSNDRVSRCCPTKTSGLCEEMLNVESRVPHQAPLSHRSSVSNHAEKVVSNVAEYGNTSAASIPLVLDESVRQGLIKPGDILGMAGFGAGLSWAGAILRWG